MNKYAWLYVLLIIDITLGARILFLPKFEGKSHALSMMPLAEK
jgi:hypothetical protein